jgi:hypothetical protein
LIKKTLKTDFLISLKTISPKEEFLQEITPAGLISLGWAKFGKVKTAK